MHVASILMECLVACTLLARPLNGLPSTSMSPGPSGCCVVAARLLGINSMSRVFDPDTNDQTHAMWLYYSCRHTHELNDTAIFSLRHDVPAITKTIYNAVEAVMNTSEASHAQGDAFQQLMIATHASVELQESVRVSYEMVRQARQALTECAQSYGWDQSNEWGAGGMSGSGAEGLVRYLQSPLAPRYSHQSSAAEQALVYTIAADRLLHVASQSASLRMQHIDHDQQNPDEDGTRSLRREASRRWLEAAHKLSLASSAASRLLPTPLITSAGTSTAAQRNRNDIPAFYCSKRHAYGIHGRDDPSPGLHSREHAAQDQDRLGCFPKVLALWPVLLAGASTGAADNAMKIAWSTIEHACPTALHSMTSSHTQSSDLAAVGPRYSRTVDLATHALRTLVVRRIRSQPRASCQLRVGPEVLFMVRSAATDYLHAGKIALDMYRAAALPLKPVDLATIHRTSLESMSVLRLHEAARLTSFSRHNDPDLFSTGVNVAAARSAIALSSGGEAVAAALARMPALGLSSSWSRVGGRSILDRRDDPAFYAGVESLGSGKSQSAWKDARCMLLLENQRVTSDLLPASRNSSSTGSANGTNAGRAADPLSGAIEESCIVRYEAATIAAQPDALQAACHVRTANVSELEPIKDPLVLPSSPRRSLLAGQITDFEAMIPRDLRDLHEKMHEQVHASEVLQAAACAKHGSLMRLWISEARQAAHVAMSKIPKETDLETVVGAIRSDSAGDMPQEARGVLLHAYQQLLLQSTILVDAAVSGMECSQWSLRVARSMAQHCAGKPVQDQAQCASQIMLLTTGRKVRVEAVDNQGEWGGCNHKGIESVSLPALERSIRAIGEAFRLLELFGQATTWALNHTHLQSESGGHVSSTNSPAKSKPNASHTGAGMETLDKYADAWNRLRETQLSLAVAQHRFAFNLLEQFDASRLHASAWPLQAPQIGCIAAHHLQSLRNAAISLLAPPMAPSRRRLQTKPSLPQLVLGTGLAQIDAVGCARPTFQPSSSLESGTRDLIPGGSTLSTSTSTLVLVPTLSTCEVSSVISRMAAIDASKSLILLGQGIATAMRDMLLNRVRQEDGAANASMDGDLPRFQGLATKVQQAVQRVHEDAPCTRACISSSLDPFQIHHAIENSARCAACVLRLRTDPDSKFRVRVPGVNGAFQAMRLEHLEVKSAALQSQTPRNVLHNVANILTHPMRDHDNGILSYLSGLPAQLAASILRARERYGGQPLDAASHLLVSRLDIRRTDLLDGISHLSAILVNAAPSAGTHVGLASTAYSDPPARILYRSIIQEWVAQGINSHALGLVPVPGMPVISRIIGRAAGHCQPGLSGPLGGLDVGCLWVPASDTSDSYDLLVPHLQPNSVFDCTTNASTNGSTSAGEALVHIDSLAVPVASAPPNPSAVEPKTSALGRLVTSNISRGEFSDSCKDLSPYVDLLSAAAELLPALRSQVLPKTGICDDLCAAIQCGKVELTASRARTTWRTEVQLVARSDCRCCAAGPWTGRSSMAGSNNASDAALERVLEARHDRENLAVHGAWVQIPVDQPHLISQSEALQRLLSLVDTLGGIPPKSGLRVSLMFPGSHVKPHGGPHNARWRLQLPLLVPCYRDCDVFSQSYDGPRLRIGTHAYAWRRGQPFYFDDALVHEVDFPAPPPVQASGDIPSELQCRHAAQGTQQYESNNGCHAPGLSRHGADAVEAVLSSALLGGLFTGGRKGRMHEPFEASHSGSTRVSSRAGTALGGSSPASQLPHSWWTALYEQDPTAHASKHAGAGDTGSAVEPWHPCDKAADRTQCMREWEVWSRMPRAIVIIDTWPSAFLPHKQLREEVAIMMNGQGAAQS